MVDIGVPVFLPASQIDIRRVNDPRDYIGQEVEAEVIKIDIERKNIVVSRRKIVEEDRIKIDFRDDSMASQMPPRYFKLSISENSFSLTDEPKKKGGPDGPTTKYNRVE